MSKNSCAENTTRHQLPQQISGSVSNVGSVPIAGTSRPPGQTDRSESCPPKPERCDWATEVDDKSYSCCHPWVAFLQATDNVSRPLACCLQGVNQAGHPLSKPVFKTSSCPLGLPLSTPQPCTATIINWPRCLDHLRLWPRRHTEHQYFASRVASDRAAVGARVCAALFERRVLPLSPPYSQKIQNQLCGRIYNPALDLC